MGNISLHVNRKPEMFRLSNGDSFILFPDLWLGTDNSGMIYKRDELSSTLLYTLNNSDAPVKKDRILLCGRINQQGVLYNGIRTCCYIESTGIIKPLREIISPSVLYDSKTNTVTLWWWTNFTEDPGSDYDESKIYLIDEEDFSSTTYVIRALCCSNANVNPYYITGGVSHDPATDGNDLSLVFSFPKIIDKRVVSVDGAPEGLGLPIVDFSCNNYSGPIYFSMENQNGNTVRAERLNLDGSLSGILETLTVFSTAYKIRYAEHLLLSLDSNNNLGVTAIKGSVYPRILSGYGSTADTSTWDINNQEETYHGVQVNSWFRMYWSGVSGDPVYGFVRQAKYDSKGTLVYVSAESRYIVMNTGLCT